MAYRTHGIGSTRQDVSKLNSNDGYSVVMKCSECGVMKFREYNVLTRAMFAEAPTLSMRAACHVPGCPSKGRRIVHHEVIEVTKL